MALVHARYRHNPSPHLACLTRAWAGMAPVHWEKFQQTVPGGSYNLAGGELQLQKNVFFFVEQKFSVYKI